MRQNEKKTQLTNCEILIDISLATKNKTNYFVWKIKINLMYLCRLDPFVCFFSFLFFYNFFSRVIFEIFFLYTVFSMFHKSLFKFDFIFLLWIFQFQSFFVFIVLVVVLIVFYSACWERSTCVAIMWWNKQNRKKC